MKPIRVVRVIRALVEATSRELFKSFSRAESAEHAEPITWFLSGLGVLSR